MNSIDKDIASILEIAKQGGLFICPTDTVWGISTGVSNKKAIERLNEIKGRSSFQSFIVLYDTLERLQLHVESIPDTLNQLIKESSRPTTLILRAKSDLADYLKAEDGTIGVRICDTPLIKKIIETIDEPIMSTSANFKGKDAPKSYNEIDPELIELMDYVCYTDRQIITKQNPSQIISIDANGSLFYIRK